MGKRVRLRLRIGRGGLTGVGRQTMRGSGARAAAMINSGHRSHVDRSGGNPKRGIPRLAAGTERRESSTTISRRTGTASSEQPPAYEQLCTELLAGELARVRAMK
jgi:hypothetical protein